MLKTRLLKDVENFLKSATNAEKRWFATRKVFNIFSTGLLKTC